MHPRFLLFSRYFPLLILTLLGFGAAMEFRDIREWAVASSGPEEAYLIHNTDDLTGQASLERLHRPPSGKKYFVPLPFAFPENPMSLSVFPVFTKRYLITHFPSGEYKTLLYSLNSH